MTLICMKKAGDEIRLSLTGHAAEDGKNEEVCTAVSMLVCTLAQRLKVTGELYGCELEDGNSYIWARDSETVRHAFDFAMEGFSMLETHYPCCVRLV